MTADATALAGSISSGRLRASQVMEAAIAAAEAQADLGALCHIDPELGRAALAAAPKDAVFSGVPSLAKDLGGPFAGLPIRAGSRMLQGDPRQDSDLAARLRASGLCFFGVTTSPEFGLSLASEPLRGPVARHPFAPHLSPGGSSGGAAAAVARGIVAIAHATDAGGSIRVPAAACGLVGLKPGRGAVPAGPGFGNYLAGIASELAICRSVRDARAVFAACAQAPRGPYAPVHFRHWPKDAKLRIGILHGSGSLCPTTTTRSDALEEAAQSLARQGHHIAHLPERLLMDMARDSAALFGDLICLALADLGGLDLSLAEPMTRAAHARGNLMTPVQIWRLLQAMPAISHRLWAIFEGVDVILCPMLSDAPRPIGAFPAQGRDISEHFAKMEAFAPLAALANISGFPALTLPFGADSAGLPLPLQLIAPMGDEPLLLDIAASLELENRWTHRFDIAGSKA